MLTKIRKLRNGGFTLIELIVALVIVGIIAAIASPSFVGLLNKVRVDTALEELLGAIRETQRMAMRHGKTCRININPNTNLINASDSECLLQERRLDDNVIVRTNLSGSTPNILFSHRGSTTKMGTIVLSSNLTNSQKCFVISLGLGIMRTGEYTGSNTGSVSASNCQSEQT